jgi:hypothetical protein
MHQQVPDPPVPRAGGLYTYDVAAAMLGYRSRQAIWRLVSAGELSAIRISASGGGSPRVTGDSIIEFIRRRTRAQQRKAAR